MFELMVSIPAALLRFKDFKDSNPCRLVDKRNKPKLKHFVVKVSYIAVFIVI